MFISKRLQTVAAELQTDNFKQLNSVWGGQCLEQCLEHQFGPIRVRRVYNKMSSRAAQPCILSCLYCNLH